MILRKLKFQLDRKSLKVICISFIRPFLEYIRVVSGNRAQYDINEIEKYKKSCSHCYRCIKASIHQQFIKRNWLVNVIFKEKET